MNALFTFLSFPVTPYALTVTAACALALALSYYNARRLRVKQESVSRFFILAIPLALTLGKLVYLFFRRALIEDYSLATLLDPRLGGCALPGAITGALLAMLLSARMSRIAFSALADALAPGLCLILVAARLAEGFFAGQGAGLPADDAILQFFPLATQNEYGEWAFAVFLLEAACALVLFVLQQKKPRFLNLAILFCACQVLLESLRRDEFLRFGFVRAEQLFCVIALALILIFSLLRKKASAREWFARMLAFSACVGLCVWMEFAIDKSAYIPVWAAHLVIALCAFVMGADVKKATKQGAASLQEAPPVPPEEHLLGS